MICVIEMKTMISFCLNQDFQDYKINTIKKTPSLRAWPAIPWKITLFAGDSCFRRNDEAEFRQKNKPQPL